MTEQNENISTKDTQGEQSDKQPKKLGLFQQIIRFGIVGFICFGIDFGLTMLLKVCGVYYMAAAFVGFVVSVIVNYILSFRFVFDRKADLDRKKEFIMFVILSAIGCGINELVIWVCVSGIYDSSKTLMALYNDTWAVAFGKVIATAIVMVYNFITRKKFLSAD